MFVTHFTTLASRACGHTSDHILSFVEASTVVGGTRSIGVPRGCWPPVLEADQRQSSLRTGGATSAEQFDRARHFAVRHCAQKLAGPPIVNAQENSNHLTENLQPGGYSGYGLWAAQDSQWCQKRSPARARRLLCCGYPAYLSRFKRADERT